MMIYLKMVISQFGMSNYQRGTLDDLFCAEMVPEFSRAFQSGLDSVVT